MSWALPPEAFWFLGSRLGDRAVVLELGSGEGTERLVRMARKVYSVEHDEAWLGKYGSTYIHAPIVDGWYDRAALEGKLPEHPDCVIVDGPPGAIGRQGMLRHLDLFGSAPLLVDDVHRPSEMELAKCLAGKRGQALSVHCLTDGRAFATIGWETL